MRNIVAFIAFAAAAAGGDGDLQFFDLGDFKLENGQSIQGARLGYRTNGALSSDKSNAILWPTWFGGKTENLAQYLGPDRWVDTSKYFVITVDALGNGVSTSPSNSRGQRGEKFPQFSIRDMVAAEYRLAKEKFGIERLYGVIGISMGGMQAFQWVTQYPEAMVKAIPIVGSPRLSNSDLLLWNAELLAIETEQKSCRCDGRAAMKTVAAMHNFAIDTPQRRAREAMPTDVPKNDPFDWAAQLRAMIGIDAARDAGKAKADMLVIVAAHDHMVNPIPGVEFAARTGARVVQLESDCGHVATGCESDKIRDVIREFLAGRK